jgi:hypothetical protein
MLELKKNYNKIYLKRKKLNITKKPRGSESDRWFNI